ncbi:MAG: formylglycine-generating enzyme family protein [Acidobacteria bacterium]|nr:formylglycine-generating enzyme family protein [Acidobacteriota bacterium]
MRKVFNHGGSSAGVPARRFNHGGSRRVGGLCLAAVIAAVIASVPAIGQSPPPAAVPDFVEIPAGPFTMGADPATDPRAFDNEKWPASPGEGTVDVPAFYLARHEVTVAQYAAFVSATKSPVDANTLAGPPTHPVTFVTWPNALAYCRWLESALAKSPGLVGDRLRAGWRVTLPTEAQWEKAARGGDRRAYPWGDQPRRDRANFEGIGTTPVGQFACPECAYGLADMSGNVWEWTSSPYQPYPYDASDDRANLDTDALWVMRGGHYGDPARQVRTSTRGAADPGARRAFIGFRVALVPR